MFSHLKSTDCSKVETDEGFVHSMPAASQSEQNEINQFNQSTNFIAQVTLWHEHNKKRNLQRNYNTFKQLTFKLSNLAAAFSFTAEKYAIVFKNFVSLNVCGLLRFFKY